jgi:hypothetical protein
MFVDAGYALRIPNFQFTGGGLIYSSMVNHMGVFVGQLGNIGAASFQWDSGTISTAVVLQQAGDRMQLANGGDCQLESSPFTNYGEIQWMGTGNVTLVDTAFIANDGSGNEGRLIIQNGQTMFGQANPGQPMPTLRILSGGLVRKQDGAMTTLSLPVENFGSTLDLAGRAIFLQGDYQASDAQTIVGKGGAFIITGIFAQAGDTSSTTLGGGTLSASAVSIGGGRLSLDGGTVNAFVNISSGATLAGAGSVFGSLTNGGTVAIGNGAPNSTLSVSGSFTQSGTGVLAITIGGLLTGQFDRLNVTGGVTLDGVVDVTLFGTFTPNQGNLFDFLHFDGGRTGDFAAIVPQGAAANYTWLEVPEDHDISLRVQ